MNKRLEKASFNSFNSMIKKNLLNDRIVNLTDRDIAMAKIGWGAGVSFILDKQDKELLRAAKRLLMEKDKI